MPTLPPEDLFTSIQNSRKSGHWLNCIQQFTDGLDRELNQTHAPSLLRCRMGPVFAELLLPSLHRTQNQCPFIQAYSTGAKAFSDSGCIERLIGPAADLFNSQNLTSSSTSLLHQLQTASGMQGIHPEGRLLRGLELRLATILCLNGYPSEPARFKQQFTKLILAYQTYFGTEVWGHVHSTAASSIPSVAWFHLHGQDRAIASEVKEAIDQAKANFRDPAVAFLIDTLCELRGEPITDRSFLTKREDGHPWHHGDTYCLLVLQNVLGISLRGIVMRLRIERVQHQTPKSGLSNVSGNIYPHPHTAGYSQVDATFHEGIRNAWLAVCAREAVQTCDYRWSLITVEDSQGHQHWFDNPTEFFQQHTADWYFKTPHALRQLFLYKPLEGGSATLPFALALRSLQKDQPLLRRDLVSTAAFQIPKNSVGNEDSNELAKHFVMLEPVGSIPKKADIPELALLGITDLVLAQHQPIQQPTQPPLDNPVEVPSFDAAWNIFSTYERWIDQHAEQISEKWAEKSKPTEPEHLDLFVWPQLQWEVRDMSPRGRDVNEADLAQANEFFKDLELLLKKASTMSDDEWAVRETSATRGQPPQRKRTNVEGTDEIQIASIFKKAFEAQRHVSIGEGVGAGKSAVSLQIQHHASDRSQSKSLFPDGRRRLVFRWEKQLPRVNGSPPSLEEILVEDTDLKAIVSDARERHALVSYALSQGRVIVILDGWDEFIDADRDNVRRFFDKTQSNEVQQHQFDRLMWIVLGRPHVIDVDQARSNDHQSNSLWLHDSKFLRLHIELFDKDRQDDYFDKALQGKGLNRGHWRTMLGKSATIDPEILGLPHTLREILRLIEAHVEQGGTYYNLPTFLSLSDLFLQTSEPLLMRALAKGNDEELREDKDISKTRGSLFEILECALSCIAIEMASQGFFVQTIPADSETESECVARIDNGAYMRFESARKTKFPRRDHSKHWEWALNRLRSIALNYFSSNREKGSECLAFRNRRVLENYGARYLTWYAAESELAIGTSGASPMLRFVGHPEWSKIWEWVIGTPLKTKQRKLGANEVLYKSAIRLLFTRPPVDPKVGRQVYRRPTELMWQADVWIKARSKEAGSPLDGFDAQLRTYLQSQFRSILNGNDQQAKEIAEDLIKLDNFVLLADPDNKRDDCDNGSFMRKVWDPDSGYKDSKVTLSRYQLCKYAVSNAQYQLFDGNFVGAGKLIVRFGTANQPAVFISWSDAFWFCEFVVMRDQGWRVVLPTEARWEYAARAGSAGDFFRGEKGVEVTESTLAEYAHYGQAWETGCALAVRDHGKKGNAWGLEMMAGNVYECCWDWGAHYRPGEQHDPTGPEEGSDRVGRGGSWYDVAANCRSACRGGDSPEFRDLDLGFRVALVPVASAELKSSRGTVGRE